MSVVRVRECDLCGAVCGVMDTVCPRCQRRGTLRDRLQCQRCHRFVEEETCFACAGAIREGGASEAVEVRPGGARPLPALEDVPDVADSQAVQPWIAAGVGGAVAGGVLGAAGAWFINVDVLLGAVIGVVGGAILGATLGGGSGGSAKKRF